jgi:uncharacterized protein
MRPHRGLPAARRNQSGHRFVGTIVEMKSLLTLAALIVLTGCASSPLPRTYVLGTPAEPVAGVHNEAGRPVVELPTVGLPDYLDGSDILVRNGRNELTASATGRWGERLSLGITHALEADLARRLPGDLVTHTPVPAQSAQGQSARSVLVNIDAFDVRPDGRCVLSARWTIPGNDRQPAAIIQQGTFVTLAESKAAAEPLTDAGIVSAMAAAVDQLADRIAADLRRSPTRTN